MTCSLAVFSPTLGAPSETFIRRHMSLLGPDRTAVIVDVDWSQRPAGWSVDGPCLVLDRIAPGFCRKAVAGLTRRLGVPTGDYRRTAVERFLRASGVRAVLMEYLDTSLPWVPVMEGLGLRMVVHGHGYDITGRRLCDPDWRERYRPLKQAAALVVPHRLACERLVEAGFTSGSLHVIPYGVSVPDAPIVRSPAGRDGAIRCLAVGRMVSKKAPILLLEAFREAFLACSSLRLLYIGEGPLFQAAVQFVRAFGLEDVVTLAGVRSSDFVQQALRKTDIFIQHSWTDPETGDEEGLPVAILEAMASSLPVAATRHAGIPDAVMDGETGWLVEPGNTGAHAQAILRLATDPEQRAKLGRQAWARAREHFTWERERTALLNLLELEGMSR